MVPITHRHKHQQRRLRLGFSADDRDRWNKDVAKILHRRTPMAAGPKPLVTHGRRPRDDHLVPIYHQLKPLWRLASGRRIAKHLL